MSAPSAQNSSGATIRAPPRGPVVNALGVARVAEGLLVGRPEARVGEPEILGGLYRSGHSGTSGRRDDTRVRSRRGENGLVRERSAPAGRPRARACAWPRAGGGRDP